ncbi:MAG TPA: crossover junction endodeoxyribonuclease RuvC [Myxococcota bacterium]|nr:crossover junction endodeoxyribonuclease RuvC [Myxococcota bacterium]
MRVLGIDPGSACCGFGVLDDGTPEPGVVASGVIRAGRGQLSKRLAVIFSEIEKIIDAQHPQVMAIEEVFHSKNIKSALVLGHARGVALLAAGRAGITVHEYSARKIKQTLTGYGGADKQQVCEMVKMQLDTEPTSLDESDALAVALCYLRWRGAPGGVDE